MKLIILRHGHTDLLKADIWQGHLHNSLSDIGRRQAKAVAECIKDEKIAAVYCSDLQRAKDMATVLLGLRPDLPVTYDALLRERNCGIFDGRPNHELIDARKAIGADRDTWRPPGGESMHDMFERSKKWWTKVWPTHKNDTILLISHGGFIRSLMTFLLEGPKYHWNLAYRHDNAGISVLEIDDQKSTVHSLNSVEHLPSDLRIAKDE